MARIPLILGGAIGFVLGARAGRPTYERIKNVAMGIAGSKPVQAAQRKADETVGEYARTQASKMTDSVADAVKGKINTFGKPKGDDLPDTTHGQSGY
ncbi:MAG: YtxH domain-containing protein [bacterium]|nr:YtxH domain-containing protein [bacterium]